MEPVFWITPDQWEEAGTQALSREPDNLDMDLSSEEPLVRVLKGHLWDDELLGEFIREAFLDSSQAEHLNHYETKVIVALGLGLYPWMKGPLGKLGKIRNKLGHDRQFSFDKKAAHEFRTTFPPDVISDVNARHAVISEKLGIHELTIEELDPEDQFTACMIELFRELIRLIEAVKIAKSEKRSRSKPV